MAQRGLVLLAGGRRNGRYQAGEQRLARLGVYRRPRLPSGDWRRNRVVKCRNVVVRHLYDFEL